MNVAAHSMGQEPNRLGRFAVIRLLDQGATGAVYEGIDDNQHHRVAIKTIHPALMSTEDRQRRLSRLREEARLCGSFAHQNIARFYEYGEEGEIPFIAMELLQGKNLREVIDSEPRLPLTRAVHIIDQVLGAAGYLHAQGILHLDFKPENIVLLTQDQVKITDFGIARITQRLFETQPPIAGTPAYMSPEQLMGHPLDARSDLFSIGVILYELLTGVRPFPGRQVANIVQRVLNLTPEAVSQHNPHLGPPWDAVLQRALAKQPGERFMDAQQMQQAIATTVRHSRLN
ncbi:MAG: serine/threonine protein kinase [Magnetococcales bacterium]|nr:serine/threonine protein kinase [Magnetococcales bacterium]MBF0113769.1 serine/threonine protein kinase [Magnetococcales bacterium]